MKISDFLESPFHNMDSQQVLSDLNHLIHAIFVCPWNRIREHLVFVLSVYLCVCLWQKTLTLAITFEREEKEAYM